MKKQRIVVKVGTSVLTNETARLNRQRMLELVRDLASVRSVGHEVVLVTSGAQGAGREVLNYPDMTKTVTSKQILCAVGQSRLMRIYGDLFDIFQLVVGQILLTRDDLSHRTRYLNARDTMLNLLEFGVIPIVNENDTTATHELRVGDNDNLSALIANLIDADLLIILTDQPGLFTSDPRKDEHAQLIPVVERIDENTMRIAGGTGTNLGTGGMATKIEAAKLATNSGVTTIIARGKEQNVVTRIVEGESIGTRFEPQVDQLESRKRWLLAEKPRGMIYVDEGAARALVTGGVSLLAVGVVRVEGNFERGALVAVLDSEAHKLAHGLASYNADDLRAIGRQKSNRIPEILGYTLGDAVIHRNNMVLLEREDR